MKAKIYVVWIALVTSLSLCAQTSGTCGPNLTWTFQDSVLTISGTGQMTNYHVNYGTTISTSDAPWNSFRWEIKSIVIEEGVTYVGNGAAVGCSHLENISIPSTVNSIYPTAFLDCPEVRYIFVSYGNPKYEPGSRYDAIIDIENNTLIFGCKYTTIPSYVTKIGAFAFYGCSGLTNITIPDSVTSIEGSAFYYCTGLTSVTLPENVSNIGYAAFEYCSGLKQITVNAVVPPAIGSYTFDRVSRSIPVIVPDSSVSLYQTANNWNNFTNIRGQSQVASGTCGYNLSWILEDSVLSIFGTGQMDYFNPATNPAPWYSYASSIKRVILYDGVTNIGQYAFSSCSAITSVTIPNSVTIIDYKAFHNCTGLASITIPNGVTEIGYTAFQNCSGLTSVTFSNSVTAIGWGAFQNCTGLTSITIPENVQDISLEVFDGCANVTSIVWNAKSSTSSAPFSSIETQITSFSFGEKVQTIPIGICSGMTKLTSVTIPNNVTEIGRAAFMNCSSLSSVVISDSVTSIAENAFSRCENLTSIIIPDNVRSIEEDAFYNCYNLKSIVIPNNVVRIGRGAFEHAGLESITFGNSVRNIESQAFEGCPLTSVTLPESLDSIGDYAFGYCWNISSITLPNNVRHIGTEAFGYCDPLSSHIVIPASVTSMGTNPFAGCYNIPSILVDSNNTVYDSREDCNAVIETATNKLIVGCKNTVIPSSIKIIDDFAFDECEDLISITIPENVTHIGFAAFDHCGFTSLIIPDSITTIGQHAFQGCKRLQSLVLGKSITLIEGEAFGDLKELKQIQIKAPVPPSIGSSVFDNVNRGIPVYVPDTSVAAYQADPEWGRFTNITAQSQVPHGTCGNHLNWIIVDSVLTIIGTGAIDDFASPEDVPWSEYTSMIDSVSIDVGVTSIGQNAFNGCTGLTTLYLSENIATIGQSAFSGCSQLQEMQLDAVVPPTISNLTFSGVSNIPVHVPYLSVSAYKADENWNVFNIIGQNPTANGILSDNMTWTLEDSVLTISGKGAMPTFNSVEDVPWNAYNPIVIRVNMNDSITTIGNYTFNECGILDSIHLPSMLTMMGEKSFYGCSSLTSINIPDSVISIGKEAFNGCSSLDTVFLGDALSSIEEKVFYGCTNLVSVHIGASVKSIEKYAFANCTSLMSFTVPVPVAAVRESAFANCTNMASITFGDSVRSFGNYVFSSCTKLDTVYMKPQTPPSLANYSMPGNRNTVFILSGCSYDTYSANTEWIPYQDKLREPIIDINLTLSVNDARGGNVEIVPLREREIRCDSTAVIRAIPNTGCSFDHWSNGSTMIQDTIALVGDSTLTAFFIIPQDTTSTDTTIVPPVVTHQVNFKVSPAESGFVKVGDSLAVNGLYDTGSVLALVAVPDSGFRFNHWSTGDTTTNISVTVDSAMTLTAFFEALAPDTTSTDTTVTPIHSGTCGEHLTWTLENGVLTIAGYGSMTNYSGSSDAPWYGDTVHTLVIGDSVTSIGKNAFYGCSSLTAVTVPNSVTTIRENAFTHCDSMKTIIIGEGVISLGNYTFSSCDMLDTVYMLPQTPPALGNTSFPNHVVFILSGCSYDTYYANEGWARYRENLRDPILGITLTVLPNMEEAGIAEIIKLRDREVRCDSTAVIMATANRGYIFDHWSNGNTVNPSTLQLAGDSAVTAMFVMIPHDTITVHDTTLVQVPVYYYDTMVVHDTTIVKDTVNMPVPVYVHDTSYITIHDTTITIIHDTAYVTEYVDVHDTTFIPVHDTTTIHVHDTTVVHFHDTTTLTVYDTTYVTEYVNINDTTTIFIHDTTYVTEYITLHDTTVVTQYVDVHDTTFIHVHDTTIVNIHDTTTLIIRDTTFVPYPIYDTIYVTEFVHDTTLVQVHDTSFIPIEVHDTMYVQVELRDTMFVPFPVHDTTYVTEYVYVRDTTVLPIEVIVHDTSFIPIEVHDTMYVQVEIRDTMFVPYPVHDTTYVTEYVYVRDTTVLPIEVIVHDTMYVTEYITDTMWMTRFDTIYIRDTVYINDSMPTNASQVEYINVKVYASYGQIVVEGANGRLVTLYSATGQLMAKKQDEDDLLYFDVPTSGSYLVKIGNVAVKQIVVKK